MSRLSSTTCQGRWIYVQSYEARRWVSPRPVRVDVGVKEAGP